MKSENSISTLFSKINAQTPRERAFLLATALVAIFFLCFSLALEPLFKQKKTTLQLTEQKKIKAKELDTELKILQYEYQIDPNAELTKKKKQLLAKNLQKDNELKALLHSLVPPKKMVKIIRDLFVNTGQLKLVDMKNLKPKAVVYIKPSTNSSNSPEPQELYRHGLNMTIEGDYFSLVKYLTVLENLPWRFYWHKINYTVKEHPTATINIEIHTFSRNKGVLGV